MLPLHLHLDKSPGLGHQRRLLAIYQEWIRRGGKTERFVNRRAKGPAVHLFDGYLFTTDDWTAANKAGGLVVCIAEKILVYPVDLVFIPCLINPQDKIQTECTDYFIGPQYFPLRDSFKQIPVKADDEQPVQVDEVFYCDAVNRSMHPNTFTYHMAQAKVIVCSSGITAYESLYLGKPTLLRLSADNQKSNFFNLVSGKYALPFRDVNPVSLEYDVRKRLSGAGRSLVDGYGSERIVDEILRRL